MGKAGGGRNVVDPRFVSLFCVYNVTVPSDETLEYIYSSILSGHLEIFNSDIQELSNNIINLTLDLYKVNCVRQRLFQTHNNLIVRLGSDYCRGTCTNTFEIPLHIQHARLV